MFSAVEGMVKMLWYALSSTALVLLLMVTAALVWGGPGTPAPIASINDPFESVDFSNMPPLKSYQGADGAKLFYRAYAPQGDNIKGSAVLVHGSSGSSDSMHPMATALAAAGVHVYALDIEAMATQPLRGTLLLLASWSPTCRALFKLCCRPAHPP